MMERNEALVRITPRPVLARLERRHDRVISFVKMFCRVLVPRGIAAPDVTALKTDAQVHPLVIVLHALFAAACRSGREDLCTVGMFARFES